MSFRVKDGFKEMLDGIKGVIFDLDGSLVDSMWIWKSIDIEYLKSFGIECPQGLQKDIEGLSVLETAKLFKSRFDIKEPEDVIIGRWNEMAFDKYKNEVELKDGAYDFLSYCGENAIRLGIASSNSKELLYTVLKRRGVFDKFSVIISGLDVEKGKPDPECYLKAAGRMGVSPEECLVFEDITRGIEAGLNAGMRVCAVEDAYSEYQRAEKLELSHYYIKDFTDIIENV